MKNTIIFLLLILFMMINSISCDFNSKTSAQTNFHIVSYYCVDTARVSPEDAKRIQFAKEAADKIRQNRFKNEEKLRKLTYNKEVAEKRVKELEKTTNP